jgi:hypothetical protein
MNGRCATRKGASGQQHENRRAHQTDSRIDDKARPIFNPCMRAASRCAAGQAAGWVWQSAASCNARLRQLPVRIMRRRELTGMMIAAPI